MGAHRVLGAAMVIVALSSCGDPHAATRPAETTVAESVPATTVATEVVAICDDAPFLGAPAAPPDQGTQLTELASAHSDLFAGVWWDGDTRQFVVGAVDAAAAETLLSQTDVPVSFRIEVVPRSHDDLQALQTRAMPLMVDQRLADSSAERPWNGTIEIDLRILDQRSLDAVKQVFAGELDAVCVTGADPATVPADGPQPTEGDGWRLLADADGHGAPYAVHVGVNRAEYETLWASLSLDGTPQPVDFASEVVVHFGAVYGSSCPEIRLDGVDIDMQASTIAPHMVLLGGNRGCTADARARAYLVAISKDHLPALPFTVRVSDCAACDHLTVTDLTGSNAPTLDLEPWARGQIFAEVAQARLATETWVTGHVDVVEVLGKANDGLVDLTAPGAALTDPERTQIAQALAGHDPQFIDKATFDNIDLASPPPGYAVLILAEPAVVNGQLTVTAAAWCGSLCGTSGAFGVAIGDDGQWRVTGPVGPQAEA